MGWQPFQAKATFVSLSLHSTHLSSKSAGAESVGGLLGVCVRSVQELELCPRHPVQSLGAETPRRLLPEMAVEGLCANGQPSTCGNESIKGTFLN